MEKRKKDLSTFDETLKKATIKKIKKIKTPHHQVKELKTENKVSGSTGGKTSITSLEINTQLPLCFLIN